MSGDAGELEEKETSETMCAQRPLNQLTEEEPVCAQTETPDKAECCNTFQSQSTTLTALTSDKSIEEESCDPPQELINVNTHHVVGLLCDTPEESGRGEFEEGAGEVEDVQTQCILIDGDISRELAAPSSAEEQEDVETEQTASGKEVEGDEE